MIADQRNQITNFRKAQQKFDDAPAIRPPIDIISQGDNGVTGSRDNSFEKGVQCRRAAVNITNCDEASLRIGVDVGNRPVLRCFILGKTVTRPC